MAQAVSFTSPYDTELEALDRRQKLAEALQQRAAQPIQGNMAGRVYVGPSWTQGLAQLVQAYGARKGMQGLDERRKEIATERNQKLVEALTKARQPNADPIAELSANPDTAGAAMGLWGQQLTAETAAKAAQELERIKQTNKITTASPGSDVLRGGELIHSVPGKPELTFDQRMSLAQARGAAARPETMKSPMPGINPATGKPELFMPGAAGSVQWLGIAPYALAQDPNVRGQVAEATAAGTTEGKGRTEAQMDLPKVMEAADYTITLAKTLRDHPGMPQVIGAPNLLTAGGRIPGTKGADFRTRQEQLKGRAFLTAFETLKGGGQITEVEGTKATDAIIRAQSAQSEQAFRSAMDEFIQITEQARKNAINRASFGDRGSVPAGSELTPDEQAEYEALKAKLSGAK